MNRGDICFKRQIAPFDKRTAQELETLLRQCAKENVTLQLCYVRGSAGGSIHVTPTGLEERDCEGHVVGSPTVEEAVERSYLGGFGHYQIGASDVRGLINSILRMRTLRTILGLITKDELLREVPVKCGSSNTVITLEKGGIRVVHHKSRRGEYVDSETVHITNPEQIDHHLGALLDAENLSRLLALLTT